MFEYKNIYNKLISFLYVCKSIYIECYLLKMYDKLIRFSLKLHFIWILEIIVIKLEGNQVDIVKWWWNII